MSPRPILAAVACVGVAAAVAWSVFFGGAGPPDVRESNPESADGASVRDGGPPATAPPLFDGWDRPAAVIVLSGEQQGYLEPCGCSETQSGGISRRADLFRQLEERDWPAAAFDLGGSMYRSDRLQTRYKFETLLAALKDMPYEVLGLGPEELRFGSDYLLSKTNLDAANLDERPAFLSANVLLDDLPDYGPARTRIVEVGDVRVGVTAVLGTSFGGTVFPDGGNPGITIQEPEAALAGALAELQAEPTDLLVLLSYSNVDESRAMAERFPAFGVVVTAGGPEDPDPQPERVGDTLFLKVGRKGKHVGVVGVYPGDPERPLRYELVDLDQERFQDTPRMREHMRYYQEVLQREQDRVFDDLPRAVHPRGADFVGAQACGECHTKAFNKWKSTEHAHAFESLVEGRGYEAGPSIPRIYDPECLACHVTGWSPQDVVRYESGFLSEQLARDRNEPRLFENLKGQQCENCHGPGSRHVELERLWRTDRAATSRQAVDAARQEMSLTVAYAREHLCIRCHDLDNSPTFEFESYWEKVRHPWRD